MKRIILLISFFFCFSILNVYANEISSINVDVYLDKSGNANITEIWNAVLNEGTEGYHPFYNLGNSSFSDYTVTEENNTYTCSSTWDINQSREEKSGKCGIYVDGDETDLCWGIGEYGEHSYTLKYKINNFIYETSDSYQILYWTFIPKNLKQTPESVYIKVHSDNAFAQDLPVWGFGNYGGTAYVYNGYIEMQPNGILNSDEYMTLLVKFPAETFITDNRINKSFDEIAKEAKSGSTAYIDNNDKNNDFSINDFLSSVFRIILILLLIAAPFLSKIKSSEIHIKNKMKFGKDTPIFRDLPSKDIYEAYFVSKEYSLMKYNNDILAAMLLKWIKDKNIEVKDKTIYLKKVPTTNENETKLYDYMVKAGSDNEITEDDFNKYCKKNYSEIIDWIEDTFDIAKNNAINTGLLTKDHRTFFATDKLNILAQQFYGLKEFFKTFSDLSDKSVIEVNLWDEYLIYAQLFGMTKEVMKEFKRLYPEYEETYDYNNYDFINSFSSSSYQSASHARSVAEARARSYSSGGGGFSSGGGGGGSFGGGGSGGGGFR
jgi:hypothetical protein